MTRRRTVSPRRTLPSALPPDTVLGADDAGQGGVEEGVRSDEASRGVLVGLVGAHAFDHADGAAKREGEPHQ